MTDPDPVLPSPLLFYDGDCGFCNRMVRFVLDHESEPAVYFSPLQGVTAAKLIPQSGLPQDIGLKSIVVYHEDKFLVRSRASLCILHHMGGGWKRLAAVLGIVPVFLRDAVYRLVARLRRFLPGKESCRLLSAEERSRFLE